MKLRATIQIRNEHMISARQEKGLTQLELASLSGVSCNLISCLERLQYPTKYRAEDILLIADVLGILPDEVMPEQLTGWRGKTKFAYTEDVPIDRLLEYEANVTKHYLLPSPEITAEKNESMERMRLMVEDLDERRKTVITLRYGLSAKAGGPYTLAEVARKLNVTKQMIRVLESSAIRLMERRAGFSSYMDKIANKMKCSD
jgi:RNA polymerase sigma factor (sigma-70 family)